MTGLAAAMPQAVRYAWRPMRLRHPTLSIFAFALAISAAALGALLSPQPSAAQSRDVQSLAPDLAFNFTCRGPAEPPSDEAIERFLESKGFRVLNKVRLAREQHIHYPFSMSIVAIDDRRRSIIFQGFPVWPGTYTAVVRSEPPTRHSADLEKDLLGLVSDGLKCAVRQVERHDNGDDARDFYDRLFRIWEGWFREADEMRHPRT